MNNYTNNQATIHTDPGCTVASSNSATLGITGSLVGGTNCAAAQTGNQGCGVRASQSNSFGAAFNGAGGGTYASKRLRDIFSNLVHVLTARPQCCGIPMESPYTFSLATPSLLISRITPLSLRLGDSRWRSGPHQAATHSSSSRITQLSSTLRFGKSGAFGVCASYSCVCAVVTGLAGSGVLRASRVKIKAVRSVLALQPVKISSATMARHSVRLVSVASILYTRRLNLTYLCRLGSEICPDISIIIVARFMLLYSLSCWVLGLVRTYLQDHDHYALTCL